MYLIPKFEKIPILTRLKSIMTRERINKELTQDYLIILIDSH
jgi:hypothetical protein